MRNMARKVDIDKLSFVSERLWKSKEALEKISDDIKEQSRYLRQTEKTFNYSKGALKTWQEEFVSRTEKRMQELRDRIKELEGQLESR
jgi:chromosome segregation ATPase